MLIATKNDSEAMRRMIKSIQHEQQLKRQAQAKMTRDRFIMDSY